MPRHDELPAPAEWSKPVKLMFRRSAAYRAVFNTESGRAVLADIFKFCGMDAELLSAGKPDETAHALGKRRVALRIASLLNFTEVEAAKLAKLERLAETERDTET